jgi:hypothetical protein
VLFADSQLTTWLPFGFAVIGLAAIAGAWRRPPTTQRQRLEALLGWGLIALLYEPFFLGLLKVPGVAGPYTTYQLFAVLLGLGAVAHAAVLVLLVHLVWGAFGTSR